MPDDHEWNGHKLVAAEWRLEPDGARMAMRIPDEDNRWLVLGWADGSAGVVRWRLTDDDVAEWTVVSR